MRDPKLEWNATRIKELGTLRKLLDLAGSLNKGNNVVSRILDCEKLSEELTYTRERFSFQEFLLQLAYADGVKEKTDCELCDGLGGVGIVGSTQDGVVCPRCDGLGKKT